MNGNPGADLLIVALSVGCIAVFAWTEAITPRRPSVRVRVPSGDQAAALDAVLYRSAAASLARAGHYDVMIRERMLVELGFSHDPGNPGALLQLVADPYGVLPGSAPGGRVLLARNAPTGHGERTVHAIPVPPDITDPLAAAAWTYDVPAADYARLARRT